ncbi:transient receptor potential cation channel subfamily M member 7-like [Anneissia japonica]|uniref:transient receptor potential cation channel subfamily M member 7-like n=1 Tax=Anneissia japonica TaxID=1529436 RepID=UPI0014258BF4|nr:transient receptor potential cation channel subfamily M member 7-like [Anneissia japonica]
MEGIEPINDTNADVFNENIEFKNGKTSWPGQKTLAALGRFQIRKRRSSLYDGSFQLQLANGELVFPRGKSNLVAKYTYVPIGTNAGSVLNYLLETANLKLPILGFSIPHTSQRANEKSEVINVFHGIIQTAINMNSWILTSGTEESVPSAVSLALKEHIIKYESKPVTIGIVSTSLLYDDVSDVIDGKPVTYTVTKGDQLDATHSPSLKR